MGPFLEKPSSWADVHHELIAVIRATLTFSFLRMVV